MVKQPGELKTSEVQLQHPDQHTTKRLVGWSLTAASAQRGYLAPL